MKRMFIQSLIALIGVIVLSGCGGGGGDDNNTTNHAPVATAQNVATDEDTAKAITLVGMDEDNDTLTYTVASNPVHGILSGTAPNLTYTPAANFNGSDSFAFTVNDGTVDSSVSTVDITVTAVNDAPTASGFGMTLDVNVSHVSTDWKSASSADDPVEGDTLTATVTTQGHYGTFTVTGDTLTYLKTTETNATDTGVLSISDGSDAVNVTVKITALYWKQIAARSNHTVAIKSDGTLWAWGANEYGQLGDGTTTERKTPVQESTHATDWSNIAAGYSHTVAIKIDGTLWAWGFNGAGQLGDGTRDDRHVPTQEDSNATNWSTAAAGDGYTVAIKTNGTLWAWGFNGGGQLGDGTTDTHYVPTQEESSATDWSAVAAGEWHTVAIKTDGTLWAWGVNNFGQLGDGTTDRRYVPTQEDSGAHNWRAVAAGEWHTVALKTDGTLWAWGYNGNGQLGDNNTTSKSIPVQEDSSSTDWSAVAAGKYHTVALKTDGTLWAWGNNNSSQLGDNSYIGCRYVPTQEDTNATNWSTVAAGASHTVALKTDGTLWAWGSNYHGQFGDGIPTEYHTPTQELSHGTLWSKVASEYYHTVALKTDGTLWAWGYNVFGQLGDGTTTYHSLPEQIGSDSDWSDIVTGGYHTVALKTDGTLWAWGNNGSGQLGDGTMDYRLVPTQEDSKAHNWRAVAAGQYHTVALKTDGTLWAWGLNWYGQLGDNNTTSKSIPVQEDSSSTDWRAVAAGQHHTVAIKTDGTLWAWGYNNSGQLGDGTRDDRHVPTQEDSNATNWSAVAAGASHTVALKTDGTLWAWGRSNNRVPTQEHSGAHNWSAVAAGASHTVALKTDGTLWAWGGNDYGQLGDGTTTEHHAPMQENSNATTWSAATAGSYHSVALQSDGTLWGWGSNYYGQLGVVDLILYVPKPSFERK